MFRLLTYAKLSVGVAASVLIELVRLAFNGDSLDSIHDVFDDEED